MGRARHEVAAAIAEELSSLGVNLIFGPVADVDSNPDNPVIGPRAAAATADAVIAKILPIFQEFERQGIATCAKHFPGHGDTSKDSHFELPVVNKPRAELDKVEFAPFRRLIGEGVPSIMTAHVVYPQIDPDNTATFSEKILRGILREEFGFQGVLITDGIGMKAVSGLATVPATASNGIISGVDLYCMAGDEVDISMTMNMALEMRRAALSGELPETTELESLGRIRTLVARQPQPKITELAREVFQRHSELADQLDPAQEFKHFQYRASGGHDTAGQRK